LLRDIAQLKAPATCRGFLLKHSQRLLENRDIFQQRNYPENNHNDARDLLGAAINGQHVDQIENKNNDEKGDQRTDKHFDSPEALPAEIVRRPSCRSSTPARATGSIDGTCNRTPLQLKSVFHAKLRSDSIET
jgi:hypothetical protein